MTKAIKNARVLYLSVWVLAAFVCLFEEIDILPKGFLKGSPETDYVFHMVCITLTLGGTWGALRLFANKNIREKLASNPQSFLLLHAIRIGIIAFVLFVDIFTYYALMNGTTPLFCALITLVGLLFCWPAIDNIDDSQK